MKYNNSKGLNPNNNKLLKFTVKTITLKGSSQAQNNKNITFYTKCYVNTILIIIISHLYILVNPLNVKKQKAIKKGICMPFFNWGGRIRTSGMAGPKPAALPLGDAPLHLLS